MTTTKTPAPYHLPDGSRTHDAGFVTDSWQRHRMWLVSCGSCRKCQRGGWEECASLYVRNEWLQCPQRDSEPCVFGAAEDGARSCVHCGWTVLSKHA